MSVGVLEHAVPADGDDTDAVAASGPWVQVSIGHYVLGVRLFGRVCCYLADLGIVSEYLVS